MDQRTVSNKKSEIKRPCLKDIFLSNLLAQNTQIAKVIWTGRKWNVSGVKEEKTFENYHCTFERKNFGIIALLFRGISTGGGQGAPPPPIPPSSPIIFLIFVLQNVTKLVLHFTFVAISSAQATNHGRFMSCHLTAQFCFHFGFELKNNYVVINI